MAKDDVSIGNLTLSRIGITLKIDSFDQRVKEATELKNVFEETRDRVLSAAPWPFARKLETLQLTGATPLKWAYRYQYPNNCIAVRAIHPPIGAGMSKESYRRSLSQNKIPFEVEIDNDDSQTICTDQENAIIEFTVRVTNPMRFNASFTSCFAWALAAEVALPLAKGIDYAKNAAAAYEKELLEASARAFNEELTPEPPDSEFVRARL